MVRQRLFIEAGSLIDARMSGTGHVAMNIINYLSGDQHFIEKYDIILLVPFNKVNNLKRHEFGKGVGAKKIYLPAKILNGLTRFNLFPPADLLFGRGVYLFPNFKNWPLLFSRSITYIHDVAFKLHPEFTDPRNLSMLNTSIDRFLRRTDRIVTVSESSRRELLEQFPYLSAEKVRVTENTVDTDKFFPQPKKVTSAIRKKYQLPANYFMFLSNIEPRKNISTLLDAFRRVEGAAEGRVGLLLVGGMGWLNEQILEKVQTMQHDGFNVILPSQWVPDADIPGLLTGAISLVHPAYHEGFGMSPLEALACGTPVVVSDIPALREVVGPNGMYLKDLDDPAELASLMEKSRTTARKSADLVARAKKFSPSYSYGKLVGIIEKIDHDT